MILKIYLSVIIVSMREFSKNLRTTSKF